MEPLKFEVAAVIEKAQRVGRNGKMHSVKVNLPFLSMELGYDDKEIAAARELAFELGDKRVLTTNECCSTCLRTSMDSMIEILHLLIYQRSKLSGDSALSILVEFMLVGIGQFLRYTESLDHNMKPYFDALDVMREHLFNCAEEIAKIGGVPFELRDHPALIRPVEKDIYMDKLHRLISKR